MINMNKVVSKIKEEKVTLISFVLAIISMFIVKPDKEYLSYINVKTIVTLFILMLLVSALRALNIFYILGQKLSAKASNVRLLVLILVALNFVLSMFITNDVALITFVPFTIEILLMTNQMSKIIPIIVLETIAANLGSSVTPIGNPQNIYLYGLANLNLLDFMKIMAPYGVISAILLVIFILVSFKKEKVSITNDSAKIDFKNLNLKIFANVDYFLLLTFAFLFIFIGNLSRIDSVNRFLKSIIDGREIVISIISSQVISNVPAAILLSKFTKNYKDLIIGCNIGGLGTLIASMASLISYKFYAKTKEANPLKYIWVFTIDNLIFLVILLLFALFI